MRSSLAWWRTRRILREQDAGPIVEFAIVVPVLLLLIFGMIDFVRAFAYRHSIVSAVREGARLAAVQEFPCATATTDAIKARVNSAFTRNTGDPSPISYTTVTTVGVTSGNGCPGSVGVIEVAVVGYPFTTVTPLLSARFLGRAPITLSARARYRWERSP